MEGKYLVATKENSASNLSAYGAVSKSYEDCIKGICADHNVKFVNNENTEQITASSPPTDESCVCPPQTDCSEVDCAPTKIILEPWSRYKTIVMGIGLTVFGIWMIIIAVIAKYGKL
ncbi:hypothetical protein JTE90_022990 [Oedothorax gibbosus]|uniref:Uncharacterized protein n=1 Tax=Oedothorax gibbosus TaxID=931172 RepID=A0AAV6V9P2_9ARAC|nr:hypothetical protein JTE90_022990 [Oedothorax gibbosus]